MPYSNKQMLRDANGDLIPQYWDVVEQEFKPLTGSDGANDVRLTEETEKKLDNIYKSINVIATKKKNKKVFGVYWDKTSNPTMTRIDDAEGLEANIGKDGEYVQNDFDKLPIFGEIGQVRDDYGNVFTRIPKFYIQRKSGKDFYLLRISKYPYPGFYLPYVFWDFENNKELDYFDIGSYKANLSEDGQRLESKPGKHPLVSKNIVEFRNLARANNDPNNGLKGYQQYDIHAYDVLSALIYVEFATLDTQSIAQGFVNGGYSGNHTATIGETNTNRIIVSNSTASEYRVGQSIGIGTAHSNNNVSDKPRVITDIAPYDANNTAIHFDGPAIDISLGDVIANRGWVNGFSRDIAATSGYIEANDGKYPFSYRGIESPWGDIWQFVDGVNINDHQTWVAKNAEDYTSNVFAAPYENLSYINHDANGYVREMGYDPNHPYAQFPVEVGGGSSTYYADYYYQDSGQRIARVGGYWIRGSHAGLSCWSVSASSSSSLVHLGGRLLKKPL